MTLLLVSVARYNYPCMPLIRLLERKLHRLRLFVLLGLGPSPCLLSSPLLYVNRSHDWPSRYGLDSHKTVVTHTIATGLAYLVDQRGFEPLSCPSFNRLHTTI